MAKTSKTGKETKVKVETLKSKTKELTDKEQKNIKGGTSTTNNTNKNRGGYAIGG